MLLIKDDKVKLSPVLPNGRIHRHISRIWRYRTPVGGQQRNLCSGQRSVCDYDGPASSPGEGKKQFLEVDERWPLGYSGAQGLYRPRCLANKKGTFFVCHSL